MYCFIIDPSKLNLAEETQKRKNHKCISLFLIMTVSLKSSQSLKLSVRKMLSASLILKYKGKGISVTCHPLSVINADQRGFKSSGWEGGGCWRNRITGQPGRQESRRGKWTSADPLNNEGLVSLAYCVHKRMMNSLNPRLIQL